MRYGTYRYRTYSEIFTSVEDFLEVWDANPLPKVLERSGDELGADMTTLYYMLYARYANSPIASSSEEQFVMKLFLTIFEYGTEWRKKLELQGKLKALTDDELIKGGLAYYNHALNPSTAPVNDSTEALQKIDSQNVTAYKKTKMEAIQNQWALLNSDQTKLFLDKFESLFNPLVMPDYEIHYITEDE